MKVLVGCEFSGVVRDSFIADGHDAYSCDILPTESNEARHWEMDVFEAIAEGYWDLIILHPPCTYIAVSGNRHYGKGKKQHSKRIEAIAWTMELWEFAKLRSCMVCLENPVGTLPMKATQYIQPWMFGHTEKKKTGLWLHNLPKLKGTRNVKKQTDVLPIKDQQKIWYMSPSDDRGKKRSVTYSGIGRAMAKQWGVL